MCDLLVVLNLYVWTIYSYYEFSRERKFTWYWISQNPPPNLCLLYYYHKYPQFSVFRFSQKLWLCGQGLKYTKWPAARLEHCDRSTQEESRDGCRFSPMLIQFSDSAHSIHFKTGKGAAEIALPIRNFYVDPWPIAWATCLIIKTCIYGRYILIVSLPVKANLFGDRNNPLLLQAAKGKPQRTGFSLLKTKDGAFGCQCLIY